jgi:uncharacterized protein with HEPN domain
MRHMLDYAREAVSFSAGRSRQDVDANRMLRHALTHLVEVIGEAARKVTPDGRARFPDIPWETIVATRNRIVHGYDSVDYDVVWRIVTEELPELIAALERALPGHVS